MFRLLSPQRVEHSSGFIVQVADRETIEYLDGERKACVTVDFSTLSGVYEDTLNGWFLPDGSVQLMTEDERSQVLKSIGDAMSFMGVRFEWCSSKT